MKALNSCIRVMHTISMITPGKEVRTSGCGKTKGDI